MNTHTAVIRPNGFRALIGNRRAISADWDTISRIAVHYWSTYFPAPSAVNTHHVRLEHTDQLRVPLGAPTPCGCEHGDHFPPATPGTHDYGDAAADYGSRLFMVGDVCRACADSHAFLVRRVCTCWRLRPDGSHAPGCDFA
jgi:hypothetical protein